MRLIDLDSDYIQETLYRRGFKTRQDIKEWLNNAPTIDAVPVVRCRDCKQGEIDDPDFPDQYYCRAGCGWNNGGFYCAYGEWKEGVDND